MATIRRLAVLVARETIDDGAAPFPVVGDVGAYRLVFREVDRDAGNEDATVVTFQAGAEQSGGGSPVIGRDRDGAEVTRRPPFWPTVLHADGWSAAWAAPRPVIGELRLTGRLVADIGEAPTGQVRGRVVSAKVVTETTEPTDDPSVWRWVPGQQRLRDAVDAGRWASERGDARTEDIGVLVDLDLDDVPPLPLRPPIVATQLAASGRDVWMADQALPLVVRIRNSADPTTYRWPGRVGGICGLHADGDGCWVTGREGVLRCEGDGTVRPIVDGEVWLSAASGTTLAVVSAGQPGHPFSTATVRLLDASGAVTEVPTAGMHPRSLTATGDGFLLVMGHRNTPQRADDWDDRPWLARLDRHGELVHGPPLDLHHGQLRTVIGTDPPVIAHSRSLRRVLADLTLDDPDALPVMVLDGWAAQGRVWILTHPYYEAGPEGWHQLLGPFEVPPRPQRWALHELDSSTLHPLSTTFVPEQALDLAVDGTGEVWLSGGGSYRCRAGAGATAEPFDVAALLDRP